MASTVRWFLSCPSTLDRKKSTKNADTFCSYFAVVHSVDRLANNTAVINHKVEYEMVDEHFGDKKRRASSSRVAIGDLFSTKGFLNFSSFFSFLFFFFYCFSFQVFSFFFPFFYFFFLLLFFIFFIVLFVCTCGAFIRMTLSSPGPSFRLELRRPTTGSSASLAWRRGRKSEVCTRHL